MTGGVNETYNICQYVDVIVVVRRDEPRAYSGIDMLPPRWTDPGFARVFFIDPAAAVRVHPAP
jgi:hypothetical protein